MLAAKKNEVGRGKRIRTSGPCLPKAVLYQAELFPDRRNSGLTRRCEGAPITMRVESRKRLYHSVVSLRARREHGVDAGELLARGSVARRRNLRGFDLLPVAKSDDVDIAIAKIEGEAISLDQREYAIDLGIKGKRHIPRNQGSRKTPPESASEPGSGFLGDLP